MEMNLYFSLACRGELLDENCCFFFPFDDFKINLTFAQGSCVILVSFFLYVLKKNLGEEKR